MKTLRFTIISFLFLLIKLQTFRKSLIKKEKFGYSFSVMILLIICSGQAHAVGIDEHSVLLMCFDEGKGDVAVDFSSEKNDGAIHGPTWTKEGKFGNALEFDGSDDYVEVPNSESLNFKNQMTIEAWIKPKNWVNWLRVVAKGSYPNFQSKLFF